MRPPRLILCIYGMSAAAWVSSHPTQILPSLCRICWRRRLCCSNEAQLQRCSRVILDLLHPNRANTKDFSRLRHSPCLFLSQHESNGPMIPGEIRVVGRFQATANVGRPKTARATKGIDRRKKILTGASETPATWILKENRTGSERKPRIGAVLGSH